MIRGRARRPMSEKQRAFLALQGQTFPRIGDYGLYSQWGPGGPIKGETNGVATVRVLDVTSSGLTVTVRFVREAVRARYRLETFRIHRRGELHDGTGWYLTNGRVLPGGEVSFSPSGFEAPE